MLIKIWTTIHECLITIISHAFGKKWPLLKINMLSDHWLPNEKLLAAYVCKSCAKCMLGLIETRVVTVIIMLYEMNSHNASYQFGWWTCIAKQNLKRLWWSCCYENQLLRPNIFSGGLQQCYFCSSSSVSMTNLFKNTQVKVIKSPEFLKVVHPKYKFYLHLLTFYHIFRILGPWWVMWRKGNLKVSNVLYSIQPFERALTANSLKNLLSFTQPHVIPNLHDLYQWEIK